MKSLAIITARGGSKRIPRKNIKEFLGKPIIQYSIDAALQSGLFDEVMVSTDDEEIAAIAKELGAQVPFLRSTANANDYATTADVLVEVLNQYQEIGKSFDLAVCIYPTAPFVNAEKLQKAQERLIATHADSLIPITKFSFPIWRSFKLDNELIAFNWPENALKRSQDLPSAYHDCGQFYFFRTKEFLQTKSLVGSNTSYIEIPESEVQDIDNEEDWKIAEIKYSFLHKI
ncbi:MAG: pseudaminic acid cytidylyltransferase [Bacteroidetes bacterium]|nr:pseudaminic acid cytidylyltransferase [Bacteroidota bacterium]